MEEAKIGEDENKGYNKKTQKYVKGEDSDNKMVKLRHFSWNDIEDEVGETVDTVIMDCEGCWVDMVDTYIDKFMTQVNTVHTDKPVR